MRNHFSLLLLPLVIWPGCSRELYKKSADRQVRAIVAEKERQVYGTSDEPFTLKEELVSLEQVGIWGEVEDLKNVPPPRPVYRSVQLEDPQSRDEAMEPSASASASEEQGGEQGGEQDEQQDEAGADLSMIEQGFPEDTPMLAARFLTLEDALWIAFRNNRNYQTQKELVYLAALDLTLARWRFAPRLFGVVSGDYTRDGAGEKSGSIASDFGWNWLLASGAQVSVSLASNFLQFFTGDRREAASSLISGTITQPLLRGFGKDIVTEPLTQAERDVVYRVRSLERFQKTFMVQVAEEYYRVFENRNRVFNEYLNWQGLVTNLDLAQALLEGARMARYEVDQIEQQELSARNRYLVAVESYEGSLDNLKITLNVPISSSIAPDPEELERLKALAGTPFAVNLEEAIATALRDRLDLLTAQDEVEDSRRRVGVAANALEAQLDITLGANVPSNRDAETPLKFNSTDGSYFAAFDLNLPFDRRAERNFYVSALISADREARDSSLFSDNVQVEVLNFHRGVLREQATLDIQTASVDLAQRRVASTMVLRDAGRVETRDVLESQTALVQAKNALISALVSMTIAKLDFFLATGALRVDGDGQWRIEPIEGIETHG